VVEHALREGLASGVGTQVSSEACTQQLILALLEKLAYIRSRKFLEHLEQFCRLLDNNKTPTKRLVDRQVGLDDEHGCTGNLTLLKYVTTFSVQHSVDTSHSVLRALKAIMDK
jgi:hypothetical protein